MLLIGPAHRVYIKGMAIPSVDCFATPLGKVELDRAALDAIATLPAMQVSDEAHREEHSLEVQLPFLQTVLNDFSLVPVVVGGASPAQVAAVIDALADEHTLIVISSDLSHFHSYRDAQRLDAATCEHIVAKSTGLSGEESLRRARDQRFDGVGQRAGARSQPAACLQFGRYRGYTEPGRGICCLRFVLKSAPTKGRYCSKSRARRFATVSKTARRCCPMSRVSAITCKPRPRFLLP